MCAGDISNLPLLELVMPVHDAVHATILSLLLLPLSDLLWDPFKNFVLFALSFLPRDIDEESR